MQPRHPLPNEADAIRREAAAFRRLSPAERLNAIMEVIAAGWRMLEQSPDREAILRQRQAQEDEWQRIQKELFAAYFRAHPEERPEM
jgi:hypothetical protein